MSFFGYQSDQINTTVNNTTVNNTTELEDHTLLRIRPEDTLPNITLNPNRDKYIITNTEILISGDIRFKRTAGIGSFNGERIFRFPTRQPYTQITGSAGITFSNTGNQFSYRIDSNGHVFLSGSITSVSEEVVFNFAPFIVESPPRFIPF